jgi:hypothetical protein
VQSAFTLDRRIPRKKLRNPHPTSVLAQLSDERKAQLHAWLKSSMPYQQIVKTMLAEWNVRTWVTSLSTYYQRHLATELLEQRQRSLGVADELNKEITRKPADYGKAIFELVAGTYFDLLKDKESHPKITEIFSKQYQRLLDYQLRDRQIKIKKRRLTILERQAAEARETMQDSKLTNEEIAERVRRIFKPSFDEAQTNGNGFKDGKERATHD